MATFPKLNGPQGSCKKTWPVCVGDVTPPSTHDPALSTGGSQITVWFTLIAGDGKLWRMCLVGLDQIRAGDGHVLDHRCRARLQPATAAGR